MTEIDFLKSANLMEKNLKRTENRSQRLNNKLKKLSKREEN